MCVCVSEREFRVIDTLARRFENALALLYCGLVGASLILRCNSGQTLSTTNPSTEAVLGNISAGVASDVDLAVKAAREALKTKL